jgi:hypothetical protein
MADETPKTDFAIEGHDALDALFQQTSGADKESPAPAAPAPPAPAAAAAPKPDPATPAPAAAAAIDIKPKPVVPAPAPGAPSSATAGLSSAPAAAPAATSFDTVELPPYSKPKSVEAFSKVKELARQTITTKDAEISRLQTELAAREEKFKGFVAPDAAKKMEEELTELRTFRRSMDIENDADFKRHFDGRIEANNAQIMTRLGEAGMTKAQLDQMAKLGGPEAVDWEEILPRLPAQTRRFIEAKLVSNEDLRGERKQAVEQARKDPGVFEKQKIEQQSKVLFETANHYLAGLPWTAERTAPANATPEEKAKIEAENAFAKETQNRIAETLKEYTPARFAELAVGTALAYKFKRDMEAMTKERVAAESNLAAVTKERDDLRTELEKIKRAGRTHRTSTAVPPAIPQNGMFETGAVALDRLREEMA